MLGLEPFTSVNVERDRGIPSSKIGETSSIHIHPNFCWEVTWREWYSFTLRKAAWFGDVFCALTSHFWPEICANSTTTGRPGLWNCGGVLGSEESWGHWWKVGCCSSRLWDILWVYTLWVYNCTTNYHITIQFHSLSIHTFFFLKYSPVWGESFLGEQQMGTHDLADPPQSRRGLYGRLLYQLLNCC